MRHSELVEGLRAPEDNKNRHRLEDSEELDLQDHAVDKKRDRKRKHNLHQAEERQKRRGGVRAEDGVHTPNALSARRTSDRARCSM